MKPTLLLLSLALATVSGAVGGIFATRTAAPDAPALLPVEPEPAAIDHPERNAAENGGEIAAGLERRIAELADEVEALQAEVARLRVGEGRTSAIESAKAGAGAEISSAAFAAEHREAILQVIAADRAAQEHKREQERTQREMGVLLARAERTAQHFGLSPEQQKSLADVYAIESAKLDELRASLRAPGGLRDDPERARATFEALRAWRETELASRLGSDLAQKINAYDPDRAGRRRAGARAAAGGKAQGGGG